MTVHSVKPTDTEALDTIALWIREQGECGSDFIGDVCNLVAATGRSLEPTEHTFLVAFVVQAGSREAAELYLHSRLPDGEPLDKMPGIECWWVAENDRRDRSDNDSAVFVPYSPVVHTVNSQTEDDDTYTNEPTHLRIYCEDDEWWVDGADNNGRYTVECWTYETSAEAFFNAEDFIRSNRDLTWRWGPRRGVLRPSQVDR